MDSSLLLIYLLPITAYHFVVTQSECLASCCLSVYQSMSNWLYLSVGLIIYLFVGSTVNLPIYFSVVSYI